MNKKIFSIFMALVMVLGVLLTPFNTASATSLTPLEEAEEVTSKVTLHKLVMKKEHLSDWDSDKIQEAGYDGTQNTDQLKALLAKGHSAKEVAGVYFAVKYNSGDNKGKYVTINEKDKENPIYGAVNSLDPTKEELGEGYELLAGKTLAEGIEFNTIGLKGDFLIEEIHAKSSYVGEDGEAITDSRTVPVEITLPLVNDNGVVGEAHVYPKNTEEKPQIDKNFKKADTENGETELEKAEGFTEADDGAGVGVGAAYKNYQAKKVTAEAEIGKNIPYEVKTEIPEKSNLAEAKWDDKMTEGLTYNKDLKVTIDYVVVEGEGENAKEVTKTSTLTKEDLTESGELTQTDNGFVLKLKGDNLELLNGKVKPVTVTLTYSATVTQMQ